MSLEQQAGRRARPADVENAMTGPQRSPAVTQGRWRRRVVVLRALLLATPLLAVLALAVCSVAYPNPPVQTGDPLADAVCRAIAARLPAAGEPGQFRFQPSGIFSTHVLFDRELGPFDSDPRTWEARVSLGVPLSSAQLAQNIESDSIPADMWYLEEAQRRGRESVPLLRNLLSRQLREWRNAARHNFAPDRFATSAGVAQVNREARQAVEREHGPEIAELRARIHALAPRDARDDYSRASQAFQADDAAEARHWLEQGNRQPECRSWSLFPVSSFWEAAERGQYFGNAAISLALLGTVGNDQYYFPGNRMIEQLARESARRRDAQALNELQYAVVRLSRLDHATVRDGADAVADYRSIRLAAQQYWRPLTPAQSSLLGEIELLENRLISLYPAYNWSENKSWPGVLANWEANRPGLFRVLDPAGALTRHQEQWLLDRIIANTDRQGETARQIEAGWDALAMFDYRHFAVLGNPPAQPAPAAGAPDAGPPQPGRTLANPSLEDMPAAGAVRGH
jgi:hypothetical protein